MKVMHIIARVNLGGTARWLETLTAGELAAGDEVVVVTGQVQGDEVEDPEAQKMPLVRLQRLGRAVSPLDDVVALREVRDLIGDLQPDVVNTHTAKAGLIGRVAALSLGRHRPALVHTVHGHLLTGYFSGLSVRGIAGSERLLSSVSDLVLAVGTRVRDDFIAARIVAADKIVAVRPGVPDRPWIRTHEARMRLGLSGPDGMAVDGSTLQPLAGWLGRLARVKRPDRLLGSAFATPDVDYIVGGDGVLRDALLAHASPNVTTLGWVDPILFWSACDLAVLTSDNEGLPTSLIEAALAGLPAVTTDAGSASEVVLDGVTGLVVAQSAQAVAEGIRSLISDPDRMAAMGVAARERALIEFSPSRMLAEHTAAYERAIALRRS